MRQLVVVEKRTVFRGGVVQFTAVLNMDENGAMTARNETIQHNNIVVSRTADGVEAHFQRIDVLIVGQPEVKSFARMRED